MCWSHFRTLSQRTLLLIATDCFILTQCKDIHVKEKWFCGLEMAGISSVVQVLLFYGSSIYDVHKKIGFLPPPVHMRPHRPDPPLWTSTRGRHEIHTALLKWLVQ